MNVAIRLDDGSEFQAHAELAKLDGDGGEAGRIGLDDREGKLTASEEAGFLAIDRDQIRLSQDLKKVALLQGLDDATEVHVGVEEKQVQQVGDAGLAGEAAAGGSRSGAGAADGVGERAGGLPPNWPVVTLPIVLPAPVEKRLMPS